MGCLDLLWPFCQPEMTLTLWKDTKDIPRLLDPADPEVRLTARHPVLGAMADCTVGRQLRYSFSHPTHGSYSVTWTLLHGDLGVGLCNSLDH